MEARFRELQRRSTGDYSVELEFRLRSLLRAKHANEFEDFEFNRILVRLTDKLGVAPTMTTMVDTTYQVGKNSRYRRTERVVNSETQYEYINKVLDYPEHSELWAYSLNLSREYKIDQQSWNAQYNLNAANAIQRSKTRYSWRLDYYQIDLTRVNSIGNQINEKFELEIELIDPRRVTDFLRMQTINETEFVANRQGQLAVNQRTIHAVVAEINKIINDTNNLYSSFQIQKFRPQLDRLPRLPTLRNLHWDDLRFGGIVGYSRDRQPVNYTVSVKADGYRKLLVIAPTGVWLTLHTDAYEFNLVAPMDPYYQKWIGTILDCELIPVAKLKSTTTTNQLIVAFDCLSYLGDSYTDETYRVRHARVREVVSALSTGPQQFANYDLVYKHIYELDVENFFDQLKEVGSQLAAVPYVTDGLVFTPNETSYNPGKSDLLIGKRELTKFPDIVKWKEPRNVTIDLQFGLENNERALLASKYDRTNRVQTVEPFKGSLKREFTIDMVEPTFFETAVLGTIYEFSWNPETNQLVMIRPRTDKRYPNRWDVAIDNWDYLVDPILFEDLSGDSFRLAFKYHGRLKKELFAMLSTKTVLDIGFGRGGDVFKMRNLHKVYGVEPNEFNLRTAADSYYSRVQSYDRMIPGISDKIKIIQTGGEDTDTILQQIGDDTVDAVTAMLSLSFFYMDKIKLAGLIKTIASTVKVGGSFLGLTVDGDALKYGPRDVTISAGSHFARFEIDTTAKTPLVNVTLPGTILQTDELTQTEGLVDLFLLERLLRKYGFVLRSKRVTDTERLVSDPQYEYLCKYTEFIFDRIMSGDVDENSGVTKSMSQRTIVAPSRPITNPQAARIELPPPTGVSAAVPVSRMGNSTIKSTVPSATMPGTAGAPGAVKSSIPMPAVRSTSIPPPTKTATSTASIPMPTIRSSSIPPPAVPASIPAPTTSTTPSIPPPATSTGTPSIPPPSPLTTSSIPPPATAPASGLRPVSAMVPSSVPTATPNLSVPPPNPLVRSSVVKPTVGAGLAVPSTTSSTGATPGNGAMFQEPVYEPTQLEVVIPYVKDIYDQVQFERTMTESVRLPMVTTIDGLPEDLATKYHQKIVLFPSSGDRNNCLIHTILWCLNQEYRQSGDVRRNQMAQLIREQAVHWVETNYETSVLAGFTGLPLYGSYTFAKDSLIRYLRSGDYLGQESAVIFSTILNVNILMVLSTTQGLFSVVEQTTPGARRHIIAANNGSHFEPVGLVENDAVNFVFYAGTELFAVYTQLKTTQSGSISSLYDPVNSPNFSRYILNIVSRLYSQMNYYSAGPTPTASSTPPPVTQIKITSKEFQTPEVDVDDDESDVEEDEEDEEEDEEDEEDEESEEEEEDEEDEEDDFDSDSDSDSE